MDASEEQLATGSAITADEIALYDRQIRLWGVEAQENIRKADILLVSLKALANEIAKNLVLAGVHSLTIIDHEEATEADLGAQFFLTQDDVGKSVRLMHGWLVPSLLTTSSTARSGCCPSNLRLKSPCPGHHRYGRRTF